MPSRTCLLASITLAAVLGFAAPAQSGWLSLAGPLKTRGHPPIADLRGRMLMNFHGQATATFSAIPGFGDERMPVLYKRIPFEVPDLSTDEIETEKQVVPPDRLKEVFSRSLDGFREPGKPLPAMKREGTVLPDIRRPQAPGANAITGGLQLRLLDLVGLTDPEGPRVYSGGKAFELQRIVLRNGKGLPQDPNIDLPKVLKISQPADEPLARADAGPLETRPLDLFETAGVAELMQGKDLFVRNRGNVIRMLGALRATGQCVRCHKDRKEGDLLGAFSYTFVDIGRTVEKELNGAVK